MKYISSRPGANPTAFKFTATTPALRKRFRQDLKKHDELLRHRLEVLRVDEGERELKGAALDRDVRILKTLQDGGAVTLHGRAVQRHGPQQRVERHVPDVLVAGADFVKPFRPKFTDKTYKIKYNFNFLNYILFRAILVHF
jgi:hypothetical protein